MEKEVRLVGERVLLRPVRREDAAPIAQAACESLPEMQPWMPWCHPGYSQRESEHWIKSSQQAWKRGLAYEFAILDKASGAYLGGCGLNQLNPAYKLANLGYWVRSSQTRRGVASEAARLLARFGFRELKLNRIEIVVAVGNLPSQRTAEKVGARREGILRNRLELGGQPADAVMFSLVPADFPE